MTQSDLLLRAFDIELPMTRRTLERVPADLPNWQPHPKSMPLGRLAMHVATLPDLMTLILTTPSCDAATMPPPNLVFTSPVNLLQTFDSAVTKVQQALRAATDEDLAHPWEFSWKGNVFSNEPRGVTILHMGFGHLAHHRAQLGMYLRLNNLPVPPVYGPSADEPPPFRT